MLFSSDGYEMIHNFVDQNQLDCFVNAFAEQDHGGLSGGIRIVEKYFDVVRAFALSDSAIRKAEEYVGCNPEFVRATLFDKTPESNWLVSMHQDKAVALKNKIDNPAWGPWSTKDNVLHVQPPLEVLDSMVSFRIHIDDATEVNGCLSVIPGTRQCGILDTQQIADIVEHEARVSCEAPRGSALVMKPLILHGSSKSKEPSRRRVLHFEYSNYVLPSNTAWAADV